MQTVSPQFTALAEADVRPLSARVSVSFDKAYDDTTKFFTLDDSILDGSDILQTQDVTPIQAWDFYKYVDYSDRIVSAEWSRSIEFPYSVSSALADVTFNNYDDYFTPNSGSTIDNYIIPKRPVRILTGFKNENIPQFVGVTNQMPTINAKDKTFSFNAVDFLYEMFDMDTTEIVSMQNVRTDQVLAALFTQFGIASSMYSLDQGYNTIPFLYYEIGTKAINIFRDLMQAEMGNLWLNEAGIIRFTNRYNTLGASVKTLDSGMIIDLTVPDKDFIINKVKITSDIRELQSKQIIYSQPTGSEVVIKANSTGLMDIQLENPCNTVTNPTLGVSTTDSWFTALKVSDDTEVTTNVAVTGQSLKVNSVTIFFQNTNAFDVKINGIELWGEPAIIVDTVRYVEVNQPSIDKFGEKPLEIQNNFIQSINQAQSLAIPILFYYGNYANQIEITIKSNPALQLNDVITINYAPYSGDYKIVAISSKINSDGFNQTLSCISTTQIGFFTLDQSVLDGTDVLGI